MIGEKNNKSELLNELTELIKTEFGFILKFTTKAFDQDYLDILDEHQLKKTEKTEIKLTSINSIYEGSPKEVVSYLIKDDFHKKKLFAQVVFNIHLMKKYVDGNR